MTLEERARSDLIERLGTLARLESHVSSSLHLEKVLEEVLRCACELTQARRGALGILDESGSVRRFVTCGLSTGEQEHVKKLPAGKVLPGYLMALHGPLRTEDLSAHFSAIGLPAHHPLMESFLGMPISHLGRPLANVYLTDKPDGNEFTRVDEQILTLFANHAALAISNAELHEAAERELAAAREANGHLAALSETASAAASSLELHEVLTRSLSEIVERANVDAAEVWLLDAEAGRLTTACRAGDVEALAAETRDVGQGLVGLAAAIGQPVTSWDLANDPRFIRPGAIEAGFNAFLAVPIRHQDTTLGVLSVACRDSSDCGQNRQSRVDLITSLANALALPIHNAELYEREQQARQAAETERRRLEQIVGSTPVGMFVIDADGRMALTNPEVGRILGIQPSPGESVARYEALVYRRPDGQQYEVAELPLQRAFNRGETTYAEEMIFEVPDGRRVPTLVNATPLRDENGAIIGALAAIQDMTAVQELERLRTHFLSMISHELKTPLTVIKGAALIALKQDSIEQAPELRETSLMINEQAERLWELIDNLLDISRIEAGTLSVNAEPCDLRKIVEEAVELYGRTEHTNPVRVQAPEEHLLQANADRGRLVQVITNLLGNAARFSAAEQPIHLEVAPDAEFIRVCIRDEGVGIGRDKIPHLFKKFSQVHDRKAELGGTGLGLAISKGIIEGHGGRIWAESDGPGKGSAFSFTVPIAPSTSLTEAWKATPPKIMVVDDDTHFLRYVRAVLSSAGFEVTIRNDPEMLAHELDSLPQDLFIVDLTMPKIRGTDLLPLIRRTQPNAAVIVASASTREADAMASLRAGAHDYITKPFSDSELTARVEAVLRQHTT